MWPGTMIETPPWTTTCRFVVPSVRGTAIQINIGVKTMNNLAVRTGAQLTE